MAQTHSQRCPRSREGPAPRPGLRTLQKVLCDGSVSAEPCPHRVMWRKKDEDRSGTSPAQSTVMTQSGRAASTVAAFNLGAAAFVSMNAVVTGSCAHTNPCMRVHTRTRTQRFSLTMSKTRTPCPPLGDTSQGATATQRSKMCSRRNCQPEWQRGAGMPAGKPGTWSSCGASGCCPELPADKGLHLEEALLYNGEKSASRGSFHRDSSPHCNNWKSKNKWTLFVSTQDYSSNFYWKYKIYKAMDTQRGRTH